MLTDKLKREIAAKAESWWDTRGRQLVPAHLNQNTPPPMVRTGTGPIFISRAPTEQDLKSGIMRGLEWAELTANERANVIMAYFENTFLPAHPELGIERKELLQ